MMVDCRLYIPDIAAKRQLPISKKVIHFYSIDPAKARMHLSARQLSLPSTTHSVHLPAISHHTLQDNILDPGHLFKCD